MKRAAIFILCFLAMAAAGVASNDGGTTSPFSFGAGARDLSLGGAGLASGDVTTAPFWNPSRLARAERIALSGFHSSMYESDVAYQYLGVVIPTLDLGCFGIGVFRLGIDGIEKRDAGNLLLGEIDDNRLGLNFAYGRTISGYDVGLAVTMEYHSLDNYSATSSPGLNFSIGRRFEPRLERLQHISIALNGRNLIQPRFKLDDENISYPYTAAAGISVGLVPNPRWNQLVIVSASLTKVDWVDPKLAAGIEYCLNDLLYLRGGVRDSHLSFGVGFKYRAIGFDYALVDRDLGILHMFSIATSFGQSVSRKRQIRATRREAEFNRLMSDRLLARNREMVSALVRDGQEHLSAGNLVEAGNSLNRALFLARNADVDTIPIHESALEVEKQLDQIRHLRRLGEYLDTATVRLEAGDYLAARHFASLALTEEPNSVEARELLAKANVAIDELASREDMIQEHLRAVDSLLSYGRIKQALVIVNGLKPFIADNPNIVLAIRRVILERWKAEAVTARSRGDYERAISVLDSALAVFPGHQWCLELRHEITGIPEYSAETASAEESASPGPLSDQLRKEVNIAYRAAQDSFERGELSRAIELWQKVERLAPDYLSVREYLIKAYKFVGVDLYSQNRLEEALAVWRKAIKLVPDNKEIIGYINRTETEIRKMDELTYDYQSE